MDQDVLVVGAGLSGLAAATLLAEQGRRVVLLEASGHIGGRVHTARPAGVGAFDLGPSFISPQQRWMLHLVDRYDLTIRRVRLPPDEVTVEVHREGRRGGHRHRNQYSVGTSHHGWSGIDRAIADLDRMSHRLMEILDAPSRALDEECGTLDDWSVRDWARVFLAGRRYGPDVLETTFRKMLFAFVRAVLSVEPDEISMFWFLYYMARCGGFRYMTDAYDYGPDTIRVKEGFGAVADGLCREFLGYEGVLKAGHRVHRVAEHDGRVSVAGTNSDGSFSLDAGHVIVALPPHLAGRIQYDPLPPQARLEVTSPGQTVLGRTIKGYSLFDPAQGAWWRHWRRRKAPIITPLNFSPGPVSMMHVRRDGTFEPGPGERFAVPAPPRRPDRIVAHNGYSFGVGGTLVVWTMDGSTDARPALMWFITGAAADAVRDLSKAAILDLVDGALAVTFRKAYEGNTAPPSSPESILAGWLPSSESWASDQQWIGAGPTMGLPPGRLALGHYEALRGRHGRVLWAGTESARRWAGYMEGAVDSGLAAARVVLTETPAPPRRSAWPAP